jgi:hypothetical protein
LLYFSTLLMEARLRQGLSKLPAFLFISYSTRWRSFVNTIVCVIETFATGYRTHLQQHTRYLNDSEHINDLVPTFQKLFFLLAVPTSHDSPISRFCTALTFRLHCLIVCYDLILKPKILPNLKEN